MIVSKNTRYINKIDSWKKMTYKKMAYILISTFYFILFFFEKQRLSTSTAYSAYFIRETNETFSICGETLGEKLTNSHKLHCTKVLKTALHRSLGSWVLLHIVISVI